MSGKVESKIRQKMKSPTALQLHEQWKTEFFSLRDWKTHAPSEPTRRHGLSPKEVKKAFGRDGSLEMELVHLFKRFGGTVKSVYGKKSALYCVDKCGSILPIVAMKLVDALNEAVQSQPVSDEESFERFRRYIHETRTSSKREKIIPKFVARFVLVGFSLHNEKKSSVKERTERELMRKFFEKQGEFSVWYETEFGETDISEAFSTNRGSSLTEWTKQFKDFLRSNISTNETGWINKQAKKITKKVKVRTKKL